MPIYVEYLESPEVRKRFNLRSVKFRDLFLTNMELLARFRACACLLACFWRSCIVESMFSSVRVWLSIVVCFLFDCGVFFHRLALRRLRMSGMDFLFRRRATCPFFSQSSFSTFVITVDKTRRRCAVAGGRGSSAKREATFSAYLVLSSLLRQIRSRVGVVRVMVVWKSISATTLQ